MSGAKQYETYEENGICYLFKRDMLKKAFDKARNEKGLSEEAMRFLIAGKINISDETVRNHLRTNKPNEENKRDGSNNPNSIEIVKQYGKLLAGNEYALLFRISAEKTASEKPSEDQRGDTVKNVFGMLYDILACYESSDGFNYIPGTDDMDGAWSYFEGEIGKVKKELEAEFLGKRDSVDFQKLERIINETEVFAKSYSVPGVVMRWRKINPQIKFFDCAFEIIEECGMETARRMHREGWLDYLPKYYVIEARNSYFNQNERENARNNLQYSEERLFQNELLRTLAMVFDNDFNNNVAENSRVT